MSSLVLELLHYEEKLRYDLSFYENDFKVQDYHSIVELTAEQAYGLSQGGGITWQSGDRLSNMGDVDALGISLSLRSDPSKDTPLWLFSLVNGEGEKQDIGFIGDKEVLALVGSDAPVEFPDGEPDWDLHEDLHKRLEMEDLRARADKIEADLALREVVCPEM
jgi:hypothetical protein